MRQAVAGCPRCLLPRLKYQRLQRSHTANRPPEAKGRETSPILGLRSLLLLTRKEAGLVSLGDRQPARIQMSQDPLFQMRSPPVPVRLPAGATHGHVVPSEVAAVIAMWPELKRGPAHIAQVHEFLFCHFALDAQRPRSGACVLHVACSALLGIVGVTGMVPCSGGTVLTSSRPCFRSCYK